MEGEEQLQQADLVALPAMLPANCTLDDTGSGNGGEGERGRINAVLLVWGRQASPRKTVHPLAGVEAVLGTYLAARDTHLDGGVAGKLIFVVATTAKRVFFCGAAGGARVEGSPSRR